MQFQQAKMRNWKSQSIWEGNLLNFVCVNTAQSSQWWDDDNDSRPVRNSEKSYLAMRLTHQFPIVDSATNEFLYFHLISFHHFHPPQMHSNVNFNNSLYSFNSIFPTHHNLFCRIYYYSVAVPRFYICNLLEKSEWNYY